MVSAGGDMPVSWLCNSGASSAFGRSITGGRMLEDNDQIVMEICGVFHRYCAVNERTLVVGKPSAVQIEMHGAVRNAIDAMMARARPGVMLGDLYSASVDALEAEGFGEQTRYAACGYSLGATYRPTWMDTTDMQSTMIYEGNPIKLQSGMTFLFNLMLTSKTDSHAVVGVGLSDTVLITESGCESLSRLPRELLVVCPKDQG